MMDSVVEGNKNVEVNFESHPPIDADLEGIATFLTNNLLQYVDCASLAKHLISLRDITQVIAIDEPEEDNVGSDEEDEPTDDIFGVISILELPKNEEKVGKHLEARKRLAEFLASKCPTVKEVLSSSDSKISIGYLVNERYINLPPQLSVPTLKNLTSHLEKLNLSHIVLVSKILLKTKGSSSEPPTKRVKSTGTRTTDADDEPIIYMNPEEEIIFEHATGHADVDVPVTSDTIAFLGLKKDANYKPFRRIMLIEFKDWHRILDLLDKELK